MQKAKYLEGICKNHSYLNYSFVANFVNKLLYKLKKSPKKNNFFQFFAFVSKVNSVTLLFFFNFSQDWVLPESVQNFFKFAIIDFEEIDVYNGHFPVYKAVS